MLDLSTYGYSLAANERLEEIIEFFWRGGRGSASELAERFGVNKRTINNDIKRLPFLERDGWTYYLPKSYLELQPYEKAKMSGAMMLAMFEKAVPMLSEHAESLFEYMPKNREIFLFDFAFEALDDEEMLAKLVSIIDERRGATFEYTNNKKETKQHFTFPVKIANFNGHWYLLALDAEADKIKSFRLNAMKHLKEMEEDPIGEAQKDHWHKTLEEMVSSQAGKELEMYEAE